MNDSDKSKAAIASVALVAQNSSDASEEILSSLWAYVEGVIGARDLIKAQWLQAHRINPMQSGELIDVAWFVVQRATDGWHEGTLDESAKWLATHEPAIVSAAVSVVERAQRTGQDLLAASLTHEFKRILQTAA